MKFIFNNKDLKSLFCKGKSKRNYSDDIVRKFIVIVSRIKNAENIYDLRIPPSHNFERIQGKKDSFSIRVSRKFRIEFSIEFSDKERTKGLIMINKLSNHYGN